MNKIIVFAVIFVISACSRSMQRKLSTTYITNLQLTKCNGRSFEPVSVENIDIQVGNNKRFHISGSLSTTEDLAAPIKASVKLKKKVWISWIPIPCERNIGSCDYDDLCSYGYPKQKQCPPEFSTNGVPCRCPIVKGNYTLPPTKFQIADDRDVLSGKYKGNIVITHLDAVLSCYNINFVLREK